MSLTPQAIDWFLRVYGTLQPGDSLAMLWGCLMLKHTHKHTHTHTRSWDFPEYYNNKLFLFRHYILQQTIFRMNHILVFKNNRIKLGTNYQSNISTVKRKCVCVCVCARIWVHTWARTHLSKRLSAVEWILYIFCNPFYHTNMVLLNDSTLFYLLLLSSPINNTLLVFVFFK